MHAVQDTVTGSLNATHNVRDNLGLVPTSRPKDRYIWLLVSQTSLGTLYSSALLGG